MRGSATSHFGRWLQARQTMHAFRSARLHHYIVLGIIRLTIYVPNIVGFYLCFLAFRLKIPFAALVALSPAMLFAQSVPISPTGLGPLQAVMVDGFARFARRDELLTAALGISIVQLLCRVPMGLGAAGTFARKVLIAEPSLKAPIAVTRKSRRAVN
jgi:uncharacterized membrane protein YbhN (UPF0104 family)